MKYPRIPAALMLAAGIFVMAADSGAAAKPNTSTSGSLGGVMSLRDEGSFFVGGRNVTVKTPYYGTTGLSGPGEITIDQMYVNYRIPAKVTGLPVIMVHGSNHTGVTFETTPDGREGWATYFVRHGHPVYVIDHVGRGRSGFNPTPLNEAISMNTQAIIGVLVVVNILVLALTRMKKKGGAEKGVSVDDAQKAISRGREEKFALFVAQFSKSLNFTFSEIKKTFSMVLKSPRI